MTDQEKEKFDRNAVAIARWSAISAVSVAAIALVGTVAKEILGNLDKLPGGTILPIPPKSSTFVPTPSPSSSLSPYPSPNHGASQKITIDLKKGQKVDRKQTVTGTVTDVMPSDKRLYLYVRVPTLQDFPFYYFPVKIDGEIWNVNAIFGAVEDGNQGLLFQTGLVLANPQDPKWRNRNSDNGISDLIGEPVGTEITVQRR